MELQYFIIPVLTFLVATLGSYYSQQGKHWYNTLVMKPSWTPPSWFFWFAWQIIYVSTTVAAIWTYNSFISTVAKITIMVLFIINACLNIAWPYFFFYKKNIYASLNCNLALYGTLLVILLLLKYYIPQAALLLIPYATWLTFAVYLNYVFWDLNKHLLP